MHDHDPGLHLRKAADQDVHQCNNPPIRTPLLLMIGARTRRAAERQTCKTRLRTFLGGNIGLCLNQTVCSATLCGLSQKRDARTPTR